MTSTSNSLQSNEAWTEAAEGYNCSLNQFPYYCGRAALDAAQLKPGAAVLDVACGPGALAMYAAKEKKTIVTCIDFSEGMINIVTNKLEEEPANVTPQVMDGQSLQFPDCTFDAVLSSFGVMLFPDWNKGLKEMVRVVKSGGKIIVVVPDADSKGRPGWTLLETIQEVLEQSFPEALPLPVPSGVTEMGRSDLLSARLAAEGLHGIHVAQVSYTYHIENIEEMMQQCMTNPLMQHVKQKLSAERLDELEAMLAKKWDSYRLPDGSCGRVFSSVYGIACKA